MLEHKDYVLNIKMSNIPPDDRVEILDMFTIMRRDINDLVDYINDIEKRYEKSIKYLSDCRDRATVELCEVYLSIGVSEDDICKHILTAINDVPYKKIKEAKENVMAEMVKEIIENTDEQNIKE